MDEKVRMIIINEQIKMIENRIEQYIEKVRMLEIDKGRKRYKPERIKVINSRVREYWERIGNLKVRLEYKKGKIDKLPEKIKKREKKVFHEECQICGAKELLYWFLYGNTGLHLCNSCRQKEYDLTYKI